MRFLAAPKVSILESFQIIPGNFFEGRGDLFISVILSVIQQAF
jgi:hypothetical protein